MPPRSFFCMLGGKKNPEPKFRIPGGRYRTRTCDLLHVKQMLYQLS